MSQYQRNPLLIVRTERQRRRDVYGSVGDKIGLQAQLLRGDADSKTVLVAMHPIGSPGYLPAFAGLARQGHHVLACGNRYTSGDASLQMENVMLDLAACVSEARGKLGYERVLLVGWSGGGSLMIGYQAESERRLITHTAAGEATPLSETELPGADGIVLMAAHRSRHHLIADFLDPAIIDENDPTQRDAELDLYRPDRKAPFDQNFIDAYRAAQRRRNDTITDTALAWLEDMRTRDEAEERGFVVHGTMADPRWLDPTIDPNDRAPGTCYLGDPRLINNAPSGLARFTTTRSWLSQWSLRTAQVDAIDNAARVSVPVLIIENSADNACPVPHTRLLFDALAHTDRTFHSIAGADHYFAAPGQQSLLADALDKVTEWIGAHGFRD